MDNSPNPELIRELLALFGRLNSEKINNRQYDSEIQKLSFQYGSDALNTLAANHAKRGNLAKITSTVINSAISTSSTLTPNDKALTLANNLLFALSKKYLANPPSVEGAFSRGNKVIKDTIKNWKDGDYDRLNLILYQSGLMPTFQKLVKQEAGYESVLPAVMAKNLDRWKALPENADLDFSKNPVTGAQEFTALDIPDSNVRLQAGEGIFINTNQPPNSPAPLPAFGQSASPPSDLKRAKGIGNASARIAQEMAAQAQGTIQSKIAGNKEKQKELKVDILKATVKGETQRLMQQRLNTVGRISDSIIASVNAGSPIPLTFDHYYAIMHPRGFVIDKILKTEAVVKAYADVPDEFKDDDLRAELVESARNGIGEAGAANVKLVQTRIFEAALALDAVEYLRELLDSPQSILPVDSTKAEFAKWEAGEIDQSLLTERELLAKVLRPNPQPDDSDPKEESDHEYTQDQITKLVIFKTAYYKDDRLHTRLNYLTHSTLYGYTGEPISDLQKDINNGVEEPIMAKFPNETKPNPYFKNGNAIANLIYMMKHIDYSAQEARAFHIEMTLRLLVTVIQDDRTEKDMRQMWGEALNAPPEHFSNDLFQSLYDHDLLLPFLAIAEHENSFVSDYATEMAKDWMKEREIDPIQVMLDHKITKEKNPDGDLILVDFSNEDILAIDIEKELDSDQKADRGVEVANVRNDNPDTPSTSSNPDTPIPTSSPQEEEAELETETPNPIPPSDTDEDTDTIKQPDQSTLNNEGEEEPPIELAPIFDGSTYDPTLVRVRKALQATKDRYYDDLAELPADASYPAPYNELRDIPRTIVPNLLPEGKTDAEVYELTGEFEPKAKRKRSKHRQVIIQQERRDSLIKALKANPNIDNTTIQEFTHPEFEDGRGEHYTVIHAKTYDENWTQYAVSIAEGEPAFAEKKYYIVDPQTARSNRTITDLRESLFTIRIKFFEDVIENYETRVNEVADMKAEEVNPTTKTRIVWVGKPLRSEQLFNSLSEFIKTHKRGPNKNDGVVMTGDQRPNYDVEHPSLVFRTHWENVFRVLKEEKIMGMENVKTEKELLQWAINKDESFELYDALDEDVQTWLCTDDDELPVKEPYIEKPAQVTSVVSDANEVLSGVNGANDNHGSDDSDMIEVAGRKVTAAELKRMLG